MGKTVPFGPKTTTFQRPIKILCLFDYACNTGFATVSTRIVRELRRFYKKGIELTIVAGSYYGPAYEEDDGMTMVLPASLICAPGCEKDRDAYGRNEFLRMLKFDHYDGCFIIQDPDVILGSNTEQDGGVARVMKMLRDEKAARNLPNFKAMYYFPIDSEPLKYLFSEKHIDIFSTIVTYTEYGRMQVEKIRPELKGRLKTILHGVDNSIFHELLDRDRVEQYRRDFFGDHYSKYIVSNINRNQYRKDIPSTLYAFKEFKDRYCRHSLLYLHMHPRDEMGWDIRIVAEQLGLVENVDYMLPPPEMLGVNAVNASPEFLNIIYNISDVYLTTTTGEGFGLTILEAMAAGLPVVAPLHTSISEIGGDGERIYGFKDFYYYCDRSNNKVVWQCDFEEVAGQLDKACRDHISGGYNNKVQKALDYAHEHDWNFICARWIDEFINLYGSHNVLRNIKTGS